MKLPATALADGVTVTWSPETVFVQPAGTLVTNAVSGAPSGSEAASVTTTDEPAVVVPDDGLATGGWFAATIGGTVNVTLAVADDPNGSVTW